MKKTILNMIILCLLLPENASGQTIVKKTYNELADAIYYAEGGLKAKKPFGILSIPCSGYGECRRICINTIRNNVRRWERAGEIPGITGKGREPFLCFLARRYAPVGAANDPSNLNKNWVKNVRHFLENPKN